jgi:hypothetical protein
MCWTSSDWYEYRSWKAQIDAELVKQTGKHLADVLLPNTQGERDQYRLRSGKLTSLFADFNADWVDMVYTKTPVKKMVAKLIAELNIPLKAKKPAKKSAAQIRGEKLYQQLILTPAKKRATVKA